jgi:hypothetical protein
VFTLPTLHRFKLRFWRVLAISGNDHNAVRTRIRPTSDVIGWRDVSEERATAEKPATDKAATDKNTADKVEPDKSADEAAAQDQ